MLTITCKVKFLAKHIAHKWHVLAMVDLFTSVTLMHDLLWMEIYGIGTARDSRCFPYISHEAHSAVSR